MDKKDNLELIFVKGDLFSFEGSRTEIVLAHCISRCARMGAGIAKKFAVENPKMRDYIKSKNRQVGDIVSYTRELTPKKEVIVLNMITKEIFKHKPTKENFLKTLENLKTHCSDHGYNKIGIPKIGCGLDLLDWDSFVLPSIKKTFRDYKGGIEIHVYSL